MPPLEPSDIENFGKALQGMNLDQFGRKNPGREALETLDKALEGDKAAKDKVIEKGAEVLESLDTAAKNAKEMGRDILAKFRGKKNSPKP